MFDGVYAGKRVFLSGHTGFKGSWLALWLQALGAEVHGYALPPNTQPSLHDLLQPGGCATSTLADIRHPEALARAVRAAQPDFVFHLAAQPLVRESYARPVETVETNVLGTLHLLEALRTLGRPVTTVIVTTDKCYENTGRHEGYRESDPLGGHDVYSMSKAACELAVSAWRRSFFQPAQLGPVATARAGNVIGGGDFAADRIVPDCLRALAAGQPIRVRNPRATRPWQHVLDCLSGYLWLGAKLHGQPAHSPLASAFNFGPALSANRTVRELVEEVLRHWPGSWIDASDPGAVHEASFLHLDIDRAATELAWLPTWDFATAVAATVAWHRGHAAGDTAGRREFSRAQIEAFTAAARQAGRAWAGGAA